MDINFDELKDWNEGAKRELEYEQERLREKQERIGYYLRAAEATGVLMAKIEGLNETVAEQQATIDGQQEDLEKQQSEIDSLRQQLQAEKERSQELEMKLSEMSKLSAGVARKSSQEELMKALRIFINKSKQKRIEKRTAVKEMVLELANANGIVFPEDLAATLDSLDDEQPEAKIVHVGGNYNDIHDNARVELKR